MTENTTPRDVAGQPITTAEPTLCVWCKYDVAVTTDPCDQPICEYCLRLFGPVWSRPLTPTERAINRERLETLAKRRGARQ